AGEAEGRQEAHAPGGAGGRAAGGVHRGTARRDGVGIVLDGGEEVKPGAGLYVHVPFCLTRCGYCDFNTYAGLDHLRSPYVEALLCESNLAARAWARTPFVSIFLGGGTPTTLPIEAMVRLLDHLRKEFTVI